MRGPAQHRGVILCGAEDNQRLCCLGALMFERWGRRWECLRGYDVTRDGWWFELRDLTDHPDGETVLFAFRPDATGELVISKYRESLDPEICDWFAAEAAIAISPLA